MSGLLGAIIATLLTLLYLYFTEKIRRRHDIYLQVVEYLDEIYIRLQTVYSFTDNEYAQYPDLNSDISGLSKEDVFKAKRKIVELSLSHGIRSKVAAEYGEGKILVELCDLLAQYKKINDILRNASRSAWIVQERKQIYDLFYKVVDPSRKLLQNKLREKSSVKSICQDLKNKIIFFKRDA